MDRKVSTEEPIWILRLYKDYLWGKLSAEMLEKEA
jgi:hypothetical protein